MILAPLRVSNKIQLQDPDNDIRLAKFDSKFKVPVVINAEHSEIHEGCSFERHIDSANAHVSSLNVAFKTLNSAKLAHMVFGFTASDTVLFEIFEGATWTQGSGTLLTIFNNERDSGGNSLVMLEDNGQPTFTASNAVIQDVTGIAGGIVFENQYTYSEKKSGGDTRQSSHEWDLKRDTTYIIRMTETSGNCKMSIDLHWYEHTTG